MVLVQVTPPPRRQFNNLRRLFNVCVSVLKPRLALELKERSCVHRCMPSIIPLAVRTTYTVQQRPQHYSTRAWYRGITIHRHLIYRLLTDRKAARAATNAAALQAQAPDRGKKSTIWPSRVVWQHIAVPPRPKTPGRFRFLVCIRLESAVSSVVLFGYALRMLNWHILLLFLVFAVPYPST